MLLYVTVILLKQTNEYSFFFHCKPRSLDLFLFILKAFQYFMFYCSPLFDLLSNYANIRACFHRYQDLRGGRSQRIIKFFGSSLTVSQQ